MARSRLAADPNYLWTSPIQHNLLMDAVHVVNDIGFLIPRFVSQEYKKMGIFLTDDPLEHGKRHHIGFLFYIDVSKYENIEDKDERRKVIISLIKDGLIEMGKTHGWSKEHIDELFVKVK